MSPIRFARPTPLARLVRLACWGALGLGTTAAWAVQPPDLNKPASGKADTAQVTRGSGVENSSIDAQLFYQLLLGEIQLRQGDPGTTYQLYLDAGKRTRNGQLFQRAVEVALAARAGEQALQAAQAWRQSLPQQREAAEFTAQIMVALGRTSELKEVLDSLIKLIPVPQQASFIASLPRFLGRLTDRRAAAELVDAVTRPWREPAPGMAEAWAASGESWRLANDIPQAQNALLKAQAANPQLQLVGLLALDLMPAQPELERIVTGQLSTSPTLLLRLAYARKLASMSRMADAASQLETVVKEHPDNPAAWLTLGALRLELRQLDGAEQAIGRYLALPANQDPATDPFHVGGEREQAYLIMAQIEEGRQRYAQSDAWLLKADPELRNQKIQLARAQMMASQGQLPKARQLIRSLPETEPRDAVVKATTEAQLLREARQTAEAYKVLEKAAERFTDDAELIYEQAMLAERLERHADAERLLRRVLALKPDHPHAHNALGYSLADRGVRLEEARVLINRALELKPDDPFITDSLGWLEFRSGHQALAEQWLRKAYAAMNDPEIAAHLGEVLWSMGRQDEARAIWREGSQRDPSNEGLQEVLRRLKVKL